MIPFLEGLKWKIIYYQIIIILKYRVNNDQVNTNSTNMQ